MKKKNGFHKLDNFYEAKKKFVSNLEPVSGYKSIGLVRSDGRVLASDIVSPTSIPRYDKSAMDGYAVKASETFGASDSGPIVLDLDKDVGDGGAQRVHTGSVIPEESDAVVMIEDVEEDFDKLRVFKAISPGENVDFVGEDIKEGDVVFEKEHVLRPFDVGFLRSLGIEEIEVFKKPRALVVPTGNEVVDIENELEPGEVFESNSLVIKLLIERFGGDVVVHDIVRDNPDEIKRALDEGNGFDLVVFSGGTSVGGRDYTAEVVSEAGEVFSHGLAIKPGKPTLLGRYEDTAVICLPGHPVACSLVGTLVLKPVLGELGHKKFFERKSLAVLDRKIESSVGYRTFTRVKIKDSKAIPIRTSGAGIQSSLTSSDGYVTIKEEKEGFKKGEEVEVVFFEQNRI